VTDPKRTQSQSRFATTVIEENVAPPPRPLPVAPPIPRVPTPVGMPAPPHVLPGRESHDDLEHVLEIERLERERIALLVKLQDSEGARTLAEREARQLRVPVSVFPPPSIPPKPAPTTTIESSATDLKAIENAVIKSRLGRFAIICGICLALGWNAFNSVRAASPEKVAAVQERVTQRDKAQDEKLVRDALEKQRTLAALRATYCWGQQLRGASARQGLDLPSLPPGGVTALRLDQGDPSKPPAFVAAEKCPDFPPLPPEPVQ